MLRRLWDLLSCSSTSVKDDEVPGAHEKFEPPAPQISDLSVSLLLELGSVQQGYWWPGS